MTTSGAAAFTGTADVGAGDRLIDDEVTSVFKAKSCAEGCYSLTKKKLARIPKQTQLRHHLKDLVQGFMRCVQALLIIFGSYDQ